MPSPSEVDRGKVARGMAACRHDPKRQHGHLLTQVSLTVWTYLKTYLKKQQMLYWPKKIALKDQNYRIFKHNPINKRAMFLIITNILKIKNYTGVDFLPP